MCTQNHNHMMHGSPEIQSNAILADRIFHAILADRIFHHFGPLFALLPSLLMIPKIIILKTNQKMTGDIILLYIHVYHKWRSHDIWFLKYKVPQTEVVILGHILTFSAHWQPGKSYDVWFLEIWSVTDRTFCHFGQFFALLPP